MNRWTFILGGLVTILASQSQAQTCASYPYTLSNGSTADATQVMADFNCAALLGAPVAFGNETEKLSLNSGSIGFNRAVWTGAIYNTGAYAYQFQHTPNAGQTADYLALQVYNPFGGTVTATALTVNGAGNVGVGTSTPGSDANMTGGGLTINGSGSTQLTVQQYGTSGFALNIGSGNWVMFDRNGGNWHTSLTSANGAVGVDGWAPSGYVLYSNGAAGGTTAWANASDARLKQNVTEISGALDLIMRLRGVRFDWRPADKRDVGKTLPLALNTPQIGFIAQEVQAVAPEAVVSPKNPNKDIYSLQETKLIPILVEAMKEQQAEITKQEAEIVQLRSDLAAQKAAAQ